MWQFSKLIAIPLAAAGVLAGATLLRTGDGPPLTPVSGVNSALQRIAPSWTGAHSSRSRMIAALPQRILLPDELLRVRRIQRAGLGIEPMSVQEILPSLSLFRKDRDIEVIVALTALSRTGATDALPAMTTSCSPEASSLAWWPRLRMPVFGPRMAPPGR